MARSVVLRGLKRVRESRYLTQKQLAETTGLSETTVSRLEGGYPALFPTLQRLAKALNTELDELVHEAA